MKRALSLSLLSVCLLVAGDPGMEALEKGGHWKRIRATAEQRVKANGGDWEGHLWLSKAKLAFRDFQGGYDTAKKATELNGGSADAWAQFAEAAGAMAQTASLFSRAGYAKECRQAAEKAVALNPKHRQGLTILVGYYEMAPGFMGGDKEKAKALKPTLAALDPDAPYTQALDEALKAKDNARIDAALQKAAQARPKEVWPHTQAATIYLDIQRGVRAAEAEKAARTLLALSPNSAQGMGYLAAACAAQGKWKDVDEALARNEKQAAEDLQGYYILGKFLLLTGKELPRAEACFRRYLGQEPEGRTPDRASAHWRLGLVLEKMGRKPEAVQQLKTALAINPGHKEAKADLKRLG